jgi:uncharacterized protein YciI
MKISKLICKVLTVMSLTTAAIAPTQAQAPQVTPMTIVIYEAGPGWLKDVPPEKQNLGAHFGYVGGLFKDGQVIAFGPQTDAVRGYYVLRGADASVADSFIAGDPGIKDNIFKPVARLGWGVAVNAFHENMKGDTYFILRYKPGPKWVKGKTVAEQDIGPHFGYMIEQSKKGLILAAGPAMAGDEGLYVAKGSKADVDTLIAADPGITSGIFAPDVFGWNVLGMQAAK